MTTTTCWSRPASSVVDDAPPPQVEQRRRLVAHQDRRARSRAPTPGRAAAAGRPDRACTGTSARSASPNRASAARAATSRSAGVSGSRRSESATSSTGVGMTSWASGSVNMNPTRRRTAAPSRAVSRPSTRTVPDEGRTRPLSSRASVDLPEPLAPTIAMRRSTSSQGHRAEQAHDAVGTARRVGAVGGDEDVVERDHGQRQRRLRSMSGNARKIASGDGGGGEVLDDVAGPVDDVDREGLAERDAEAHHEPDDAGRVDASGSSRRGRRRRATARPT